LLCAVDNSKDVDLIGFDVIDDSKGAFEYLPGNPGNPGTLTTFSGIVSAHGANRSGSGCGVAAKPENVVSVSGFRGFPEHIRDWRPEASMRPTNPGNISVTASYPWPVLDSVAQALLPVFYAWNASALATGRSACATAPSHDVLQQLRVLVQQASSADLLSKVRGFPLDSRVGVGGNRSYRKGRAVVTGR
jgi:hypothetical protein